MNTWTGGKKVSNIINIVLRGLIEILANIKVTLVYSLSATSRVLLCQRP